MSTKDMMVTVVGWAATTAREVIGDGVPFSSFRLATTPRYFDNRQGQWADGRTEWITVKVFRDVAFNVAASVHKGDPVLVHGRLHTEEWVSENGPRSGLVLDATALGHDLTRGTAKFARRVHVNGSSQREQVAAGEGATTVGVAVPGSSGIADVEDPWATDGDLDDVLDDDPERGLSASPEAEDATEAA